MNTRFGQTGRTGISLMEILIGIMVLGIGVISLATLFPLGLLRMRKSVNDTRAGYLGRSALAEIRVRNLLAPPYGPLANAFRADPLLSNGEPDPGPPTGTVVAMIPLSGPGMPVVIDPLGVMNHSVFSTYADYPTYSTAALPGPSLNDKRLGYLYDLASSSVANHGIPRFRGNFAALALAQQIFSAPDDLNFNEENRALLVQSGTGASPQYLSPTNGLPFIPGTVFREPRYSWFIIARKMDAGQTTAAATNGRSDDDDNSDGVIGGGDISEGPLSTFPTVSDLYSDEWNNPGPDGRYGYRSGTLASQDTLNGNGIPDDAEDDTPVGPFEVSIAVFYQRDFVNGERVFRFVYPFGPDGAPGTVSSDDDGNTVTDFYADGTPDWNEFLWPGSDDAPLDVLRIPLAAGAAAPEIPRDSFILDATYDLDSTRLNSSRTGYWYRVVGKEQIVDAGMGGIPVLQLTLAGPVKAYTRLLTGTYPFTTNGIGTGVFMKGLVGVYEKAVP